MQKDAWSENTNGMNTKGIRIETSKAIPIKCFVSHRPTDPFFFWKSKKQKFRITCKEASTLVYKHTILSY